MLLMGAMVAGAMNVQAETDTGAAIWKDSTIGNPLVLSSQALDMTFNEGGGPERVLVRPGGDAIKFRSDQTVFSVLVRDAQGKESAIPLSDLCIEGKDRLIARSQDHSRQVVFRISHGARHIGLRIAEVHGLAKDREGVRIAFYDISGKCRLHAIDLDWIYQNLPQPVTAHDSSGLAPRAYFEYRFNSTRRQAGC